ncbi:MAG TPA: hypothetical protein VLT45_07625 [Kofleriaceae bacterium]|nr:hypothetical protein [Kofleriaceae bacterium]
MKTVVTLGWLGCFAAGWLSHRDAPAAHPAATPAPRIVATTAAAPAPVRAAVGRTELKPIVYPHMVLTDEERELLTMTPEQAVAKGDAMGASAQHIARCHELLPDPPELCAQLDVTMHHLRLAETANLRDFLSGTLETTAFQEQHHRNMLAWQLELEDQLTYDQMMRYPGMEPGDDPFLVVTAWGIALPPGYTLGEDILMRQQGEAAANQPENPRDPWTYGKKIADGETP